MVRKPTHKNWCTANMSMSMYSMYTLPIDVPQMVGLDDHSRLPRSPWTTVGKQHQRWATATQCVKRSGNLNAYCMCLCLLVLMALIDGKAIWGGSILILRYSRTNILRYTCTLNGWCDMTWCTSSESNKNAPLVHDMFYQCGLRCCRETVRDFKIFKYDIGTN